MTYSLEICSYTQHIYGIFLGLLLFLSGFVLRWISVVNLKEQFTVRVAISDNHKLITNGIFKYLRHPSYAGMILYYLGLGLLMHNFLSLIILLVFSLVPIVIRINHEETVLTGHFGNEYIEYKSSSWKLIPYLY